MRLEREFTDAQLEAGIANALGAGDTAAVAGLLGALSLQNPKRAEMVLDTLRVAAEIAKERHGNSTQEDRG